uniref:Uncharacterized protein n=1 Tax=Anguilla anguilla TaxID=7936 RepID=A0A0E9TSZ7_ANGAN
MIVNLLIFNLPNYGVISCCHVNQ